MRSGLLGGVKGGGAGGGVARPKGPCSVTGVLAGLGRITGTPLSRSGMTGDEAGGGLPGPP